MAMAVLLEVTVQGVDNLGGQQAQSALRHSRLNYRGMQSMRLLCLIILTRLHTLGRRSQAQRAAAQVARAALLIGVEVQW